MSLSKPIANLQPTGGNFQPRCHWWRHQASVHLHLQVVAVVGVQIHGWTWAKKNIRHVSVMNVEIIHVERRDDLMRYYAFSRSTVSFNSQGDKTLFKPSCKNKLRIYENRWDSFWLIPCRGLSHRSQSQWHLPFSLSSCPFPVPHFPGQGLLISWHFPAMKSTERNKVFNFEKPYNSRYIFSRTWAWYPGPHEEKVQDLQGKHHGFCQRYGHLQWEPPWWVG